MLNIARQKARNSPSTEPGIFYGYFVVLFALCIMTAIYGTQLAFGVFFKPVLTEFGWTRAMTSGAFSLSLLMHGVLGVVMGGLNDRIGPRIVLTICGVLVGTGYLLTSQISSLWQLYLFYGVIIGVGQSGAWVPLLSTVARWFTARRSLMCGIILTGTGIGTLIAAPVSTRLISTYDWRTSYVILGIALLVIIILAAQFLKRDPSQLGQVPYGENKEGERNTNSETEGYSLSEAFHTWQFWVLISLFFCFGFLFFSVMVHIVPHSTDLGISTTNAANILATIGGLAIAGRVVMGIVADRIGNRRALLIGYILLSASVFLLVPATKMWMFYLFAVIFGFSHAGMGSSESPLVAKLFGLRSHGLILGFIDMSFTVGAAIGPVLSGYVFDLTGRYQAAFLLCAALGIAGIILTALLRPMKGQSDQNGVALPI